VVERPPHSRIVWVTLLASAAMFAWMARPIALGVIPLTNDLLHFHYPLRDFYSGALARDVRFEWMPTLLGGFDVAAEGQLGAYHPVHWLLYRFLPLDRAFDIELVAAYPILFSGTWFFLRRWCDAPAALFGAMLFTFCGFTLSHGVHPNMVTIVAHLPWLLWAVHAAFAAATWRGRLRAGAAIALLTGSQLLLGHPQAVWFSGLTEAAYALYLLVTAGHGKAAGAVTVLSGKLLGVGIGAIQLLATWTAMEHSTRVRFEPAFAETFSLPPLHLLQLLHPYLLWGRVLRWTALPAAGDEFAVYGGAVPLVLVVWWLARYPGRRSRGETTASDRLALVALGFGVIGLWLATGPHGGLYTLQTFLPVVGKFRAPVRFVVCTQLALAVVAAVAMTPLLRSSVPGTASKTPGLWAPWTLVGLSIISGVWLAFTLDVNVTGAPSFALAAVLGPLLLASAAGLLTLAARGARWALPALVLLAAGDQALYGLAGVAAWQDFVTRNAAVRLLGPEESLPPRDAGRIVCCPFPDLYELAGYSMIEGYVGLTPQRALGYRTPRSLRVANVAYAHRIFVDAEHPPDTVQISRDWYRLPAPLPRARLVTETRVSSQPADDLEAIDVDRAALVTQEVGPTEGSPGLATIVDEEPGRIHVETRADGRQLLVVSEEYDEGWIVQVDGRLSTLERVNGDFIGSVVPPGRHEALFEFRPSYRSTGGLISLSALALVVLAAAAGLSRRGA
jgi:hypothetical protein